MQNKIRWGVLSTAKIGREKVIPGIQKSSNGTVAAICSRNQEQAENTAKFLKVMEAFMYRFHPQWLKVKAPKDASSKVWVRTKTSVEEIVVAAVDQYTVQAEMFGTAILEDGPVPIDLTDSVNNMKVTEALFASAERNGWVDIE